MSNAHAEIIVLLIKYADFSRRRRRSLSSLVILNLPPSLQKLQNVNVTMVAVLVLVSKVT